MMGVLARRNDMAKATKAIWLRSMYVGAFVVLGASLAFALGARVGGAIDRSGRSVAVVPAPTEQAPAVAVK